MHYRRVLKTGDPGPAGPKRALAKCRVDGCGKELDAKGLCHGHYQRLLRGAEKIETPLRVGRSSCLVEVCDRPVQAKGYCGAHYKRVLAHGDPLADIPIRKSSGDGYLHHGYVYVPVPIELRYLSSGQRKTAEHRLIMAEHLGRALFPDEQVHHINGVRDDNRLENLELWSTSHPSGQRIDDLIEWCQVILTRYGEEYGLFWPGGPRT